MAIIKCEATSMRLEQSAIAVGDISNFYGGLGIATIDGKCFWGIEDYSGCRQWEQIPQSLFDELVKFATAKSDPA